MIQIATEDDPDVGAFALIGYTVSSRQRNIFAYKRTRTKGSYGLLGKLLSWAEAYGAAKVNRGELGLAAGYSHVSCWPERDYGIASLRMGALDSK
jgi:hypothetical protein